MQKKLDAEQWKIERLVRTEGTFIANQASLRGYEEAGIKHYRFVARLDQRTSRICLGMHKQIFKVKDAIAGVNLPPLHPWCRSTTVPVFDKEKEKQKEIEEIKKGKKSEEELREEYDFLLSLGDKYSHRPDKYSIHPFQTFRMYKKRYNETFDLIAGLEVKGTKIKNLSAHSVKRMLDRGILPKQMKDILTEQKNVGNIEYENKRYKFKLINDNDTIIINPNTGGIVTIWYKE